MNLEIIHFLKQIGDDQQLLARLGSCPEPAEIVKAAREAGYQITEEEYLKTVEVIKGILKAMTQDERGELSDDSLDTVVGGIGPNLMPILEDLNLETLKKLLGI
jgi:predicted ribosomally synthesized peptide with nif11-like leader